MTYERRAEKERLDRLRGDDLNMPFLKEGFVPEIWVFRQDAEGCYLVRTPTTGMFWVETKARGWRIYRYFDKPIR